MPINLTVYGQTDVGVVRKNNEDSFVIADLTGGNLVKEGEITRFEVRERGVLLAVSDGMGGQQAGEVASALVVGSLQRSMTTQAGQGSPDDALMEKAVLSANRAVWEAAHESGQEKMGATLTAVYVHGPVAHIASVGDSRAYLLRGGVIEQVTKDQSYVQLLIDAGAVTPEQAEHSPMKNIILQAMGQKPTVSVAMGRLELRQKDCFILCSDGLSNKVPLAEVRDVILGARRLDAACARLVELAKERGGEDNITVIVAGVSGNLPRLTPGETIADTLEVLQEFDAPVPKV